MIFENCAIGRTKIILSIEDSEPASGFLAVLSAEIDNNLKEEVNFRGPGEFAPSTQEHIRSIIYPLITKILTKLKINPTPIVISLANVGAASIQKQKLYVKGFSADIPIFLSILSIYLNIPLPQDYVITGHISSNQGDISLVEAIPGKIHGTMRYSEISHFVCPDPDMDQSAKIINPGSTEEIKISIANAKKNIKFILLKSLSDLIGTVIKEQAMLYSALRSGFYNQCTITSTSLYPHYVFVQKLSQNHEERFWNFISESLFADRKDTVQNLISLHIQHQVKINSYPQDFGSHFFNILSSLPPSKRPKRIIDHFITGLEMRNLANLADDHNISDFMHFVETISSYDTVPSGKAIKNPESDDEYDHLFTFLLDELDEINIVRTVTGPIDNARGTYLLGKNQLEDYNEFLAVIESFYLHIIRSTGTLLKPFQHSKVGPEALSLLNRSFRSETGVETAWRQSKLGLNGGLRSVLDMMTDQYKEEKTKEHVEYIIAENLDPDNWPDSIKFGEAEKRYFKQILPVDINELSANEIALDYKNVIRTIINTLDSLKRFFRTRK